MKEHSEFNYRPLIGAGVLLGLGMGGFFDGILFHQVLQIHNMLSATVPKTSVANVEVNMFWDGLFHTFTWIITALGIAALWRAGKHAEVPWSTRAFVGSLFLGWGMFNFIEGLIDHHLLGIHHVVEALGVSIYDSLYLASGVVFIIAGGLAIRSGKRRDTEHVWHPGMTRKPA
jgi:uncharacterized membrane protein